MKLSRFSRYAWFVLGFNLLIILWGAYVRASGSGAGCGSHWPLCNGQVIPQVSHVSTWIEFAHRISSGIGLLLVVGQWIWAFRAFERGDQVRRAASFSLFLMITEALVGAGLVLFQLVADNESFARALFVATHLLNTFLLLGALTLTAWLASGGMPIRLRKQGAVGWLLFVGILGTLLLGASGAVTALGDTLFPSRSLAEGLSQDFSATAHFLIRLRLFHPLIAISVGIYLVVAAALAYTLRSDRETHIMARVVGGLFVLQLLVGTVNVALLAPISVQLIHLLLADFVWIALVLLTASALADRPATTQVTAATSERPIVAPDQVTIPGNR